MRKKPQATPPAERITSLPDPTPFGGSEVENGEHGRSSRTWTSWKEERTKQPRLSPVFKSVTVMLPVPLICLQLPRWRIEANAEKLNRRLRIEDIVMWYELIDGERCVVLRFRKEAAWRRLLLWEMSRYWVIFIFDTNC